MASSLLDRGAPPSSRQIRRAASADYVTDPAASQGSRRARPRPPESAGCRGRAAPFYRCRGGPRLGQPWYATRSLPLGAGPPHGDGHRDPAPARRAAARSRPGRPARAQRDDRRVRPAAPPRGRSRPAAAERSAVTIAEAEPRPPARHRLPDDQGRSGRRAVVGRDARDRGDDLLRGVVRRSKLAATRPRRRTTMRSATR